MKNTVNAAILLCSGISLSVHAVEWEGGRIFSNESEAGIVVSNGNSQSQTFNFKQLNTYEWSDHLLKLTGRYIKSGSRGEDTALFWSAGLRYERILTERFRIFVAQELESDLFAGYLQRYNTDVGVKYSVIKVSDLVWNVEAGYRFKKEHRLTPPDLEHHLGRLYSDVNKVWSSTLSTLLWIEYLPNFTNSSGYQINSEVSLTAMMNQVLSLKSAYLLKFNNVPSVATADKTDTLLTTSLVAKF